MLRPTGASFRQVPAEGGAEGGAVAARWRWGGGGEAVERRCGGGAEGGAEAVGRAVTVVRWRCGGSAGEVWRRCGHDAGDGAGTMPGAAQQRSYRGAEGSAEVRGRCRCGAQQRRACTVGGDVHHPDDDATALRDARLSDRHVRR